MKETAKKILDETIAAYPSLSLQKGNILSAAETIAAAYGKNKKLLVCGNGGSAADSEHIVGELMKSFREKRPIDESFRNKLCDFGDDGKLLAKTLQGTLRAVALTSHIALSTAFSNDENPAVTFAQQLYGFADEGDVLLTISTSGNSENCVLAAITARAVGCKIVALTGEKESKLSRLADVAIRVPETETYKVQELHLPIYHCICAMLEEEFF